MWTPEMQEDCAGEIDWEGSGSTKWHCTKCGYIGWASVTRHAPLLSTKAFFDKCEEFYRQQHAGDPGVQDQMNFLMAAVLRIGAVKKPQELREFVEKISRL